MTHAGGSDQAEARRLLAAAGPVNPYTGGPMQSGTGPGEYRYESWGMNGFRLTGYGPHGKTLIVQTVDDLSNE